ncbi:LuxR C-terminal-related transcriptional regulator [Terracoccus sp. 273MFTsu3.1]|uniref:LuxR C-terminal-related transcriptional regulator n=1 Tax=Terracoccus sp. 273MFTsu3.1 TaxID=1172188 RepID=UPI00037A0C4E|nr:LuxR C-terminal-related transcriptional regulator [Terracoccus sp. 273MFTsu3.1]
MPNPLVLTKLHIPEVRRGLVPRPRLVDGPARTSPLRLTLVSAPPGFGKTTLLASWAEAARAAGRAVAWVSLEETEQQPASFWRYVVTALDGAAPGVGAGALALLGSANPPVEAVLTLLLNDLSARPEGLDLVLDDYHLADGSAIADDVAFLLLHLPPHVHLVISTRADPALPLARLRARGELVEVRAAGLRFTVEEVAAYLNGVAGLNLTTSDIAALEGRTEGWIAALQLAALSLTGREDVAGFIEGFAGDDRYLVDYLVEEVIGRQPPEVRRFLLETSILERLSGPLCDAVTEQDDGRAMLERLDRSNLFVVPLDGTRHWYRYHHLFAEVLRTHLVTEAAGRVSDLHRRAARWYAVDAEPVPAVRHALAAGDLELAADVMERSAIGLLRQRQEATVRGWVDDLPAEVVRRRPVLAVGFIGSLMSTGDFRTVPGRLDELEHVLAEPPADLVVLEEHELARLPGAMETYRAALALVGGDAAGTVAHADLAISRAAPGDDLTVAAAAALSGLASWAGGELESAHRAYSLAVTGLERAGNISDVLGCSITLGDLRVTQGRLSDAERTYREALRLASVHEVDGPLRGEADMLVGLSQIALERNDIAAATAHLEQVAALGEGLGLPQHPYRWRVARARLLETEGDLSGAATLLEEAERVYVGDFSPDVCPVAARRARVLVRQGRLDEALDWARARQLTADDDLAYVREFEHLTLARILLCQKGADGAARAAAYGLLDRVRVAAEEGGRTGTLIEILALQALALHASPRRSDPQRALDTLTLALRLAEREGYARVFVGEGPPMADLLGALVRRDPGWRYPRRLLDAFAGVSPAAPRHGLVDPLSARELDVLRLLASDLSGPAIASELYVSLNTMRTHTKNVYAKLGVNERRAAVTKARELGLL